MTRTFRTLLGSLFILTLAVSVSAQKTSTPELRLKDINGRALRLSDYRGKVVLVNFWATWCPPCRKEVPDLIKLQRDSRKQGLRVIGVTYPPQKLSEVRRFARQMGINYPVGLGKKETSLEFTSSENLPLTIVIGRDGSIREVIEGILLPEEFQSKIKPLLE